MSVGEGHVYVAKSLALSRDFNVNEYWGNAGVDVIKVGDNYYLPYAFLNSFLMAILLWFAGIILFIHKYIFCRYKR